MRSLAGGGQQQPSRSGAAAFLREPRCLSASPTLRAKVRAESYPTARAARTGRLLGFQL